MTYRAGVIGCGRMAGTIDDEIQWAHNDFILPYGHANGYAALSEVELVAAADTVPDKLESWCHRFAVPGRYTDYREMLAAEALDVVSVTTPAHARAQPLLHAAEAGVRGIYAEKALCVSATELDAIVATCKAHGTHLVYGAMRRYWAGFEAARDFLDSGALGAPKAALIGATSGSALHTHSHIVDAALYLLGDPLPVSVNARLRGRDGGDLHVQEGAEGIEVADDPGIISAVIHMEDGRRLVCTDLPSLDIEIVCDEGTLRNSGDSSYWIPRKRQGRYDWQELPFLQWQARSGTVAIIQDLLQALDTGVPTRSGIEVVRRGMEILFGLVASHHAGGVAVDLPLTQRHVRVMSH
jgi:UDP-N-acetyl-2-amino-2-deoxyglucuronate dehydrogenase